MGEQLAVPQPDEWNKFAHTLQELKNNKIEEDLDRGLTGGLHAFGGMSSHSSLTSGYQSSLGGHSGPSSLGSLQPSLQSSLR